MVPRAFINAPHALGLRCHADTTYPQAQGLLLSTTMPRLRHRRCLLTIADQRDSARARDGLLACASCNARSVSVFVWVCITRASLRHRRPGRHAVRARRAGGRQSGSCTALRDRRPRTGRSRTTIPGVFPSLLPAPEHAVRVLEPENSTSGVFLRPFRPAAPRPAPAHAGGNAVGNDLP